MEWFNEFLGNKTLINPLVAWLIAQIIKFFLYLIMNKEIRFERIFGDGGMPSGHSATVSALTVTSMLEYGVGSFQFAISGILAIIVMHDASGVRLETGKHAKAINEIFEMLQTFGDDTEEIKMEKLRELVGHTRLQVFCGMLLGIAVALIFR